MIWRVLKTMSLSLLICPALTEMKRSIEYLLRWLMMRCLDSLSPKLCSLKVTRDM